MKTFVEVPSTTLLLTFENLDQHWHNHSNQINRQCLILHPFLFLSISRACHECGMTGYEGNMVGSQCLQASLLQRQQSNNNSMYNSYYTSYQAPLPPPVQEHSTCQQQRNSCPSRVVSIFPSNHYSMRPLQTSANSTPNKTVYKTFSDSTQQQQQQENYNTRVMTSLECFPKFNSFRCPSNTSQPGKTSNNESDPAWNSCCEKETSCHEGLHSATENLTQSVIKEPLDPLDIRPKDQQSNNSPFNQQRLDLLPRTSAPPTWPILRPSPILPSHKSPSFTNRQSLVIPLVPQNKKKEVGFAVVVDDVVDDDDDGGVGDNKNLGGDCRYERCECTECRESTDKDLIAYVRWLRRGSISLKVKVKVLQ